MSRRALSNLTLTSLVLIAVLSSAGVPVGAALPIDFVQDFYVDVGNSSVPASGIIGSGVTIDFSVANVGAVNNTVVVTISYQPGSGGPSHTIAQLTSPDLVTYNDTGGAPSFGPYSDSVTWWTNDTGSFPGLVGGSYNITIAVSPTTGVDINATNDTLKLPITLLGGDPTVDEVTLRVAGAIATEALEGEIVNITVGVTNDGPGVIYDATVALTRTLDGIDSLSPVAEWQIPQWDDQQGFSFTYDATTTGWDGSVVSWTAEASGALLVSADLTVLERTDDLSVALAPLTYEPTLNHTATSPVLSDLVNITATITNEPTATQATDVTVEVLVDGIVVNERTLTAVGIAEERIVSYLWDTAGSTPRQVLVEVQASGETSDASASTTFELGPAPAANVTIKGFSVDSTPVALERPGNQQWVDVTIETHNGGTLAAKNVAISVTDGKDTNGTTVASLAVGAEARWSGGLQLATAEQDGVVQLVATVGGQVAKVDVTIPGDVDAPALVAESIAASPASIEAGQGAVALNLTLHNSGDGPSEPLSVPLLSLGPSNATVTLPSVAFPAIAAGESASASVSWTPTNGTVGVWQINATVGGVTVTTDVTVTPTKVAALELSVLNGLFKGTLETGKRRTVTVKVTVNNTGTAIIDNITVMLFDTAKSEIVDSEQIVSLAPHEGKTVELSLSAGSGTRQLMAKATATFRGVAVTVDGSPTPVTIKFTAKTPGFELLAVIGGLGTALLLLRRRGRQASRSG